VATKWQKTTVSVPTDWDPEERHFFGDMLVEYVRQRTEKGKGPGGASFPSYSKEYADSLDFKIAGKSKSKVDLTLSGDMLGAMDVLSTKRGKITYGFENGTEENAKADGNIRGTYGQSKPNSKKARKFLPLTKAELQNLMSQFEDMRGGEDVEADQLAKKALSAFLESDDGG
jgi:hypothetical protein